MKLIGGKMLLRSLEKMRHKCLMRVADLYRGNVYQSNGGGYRPWGGWKCNIHSPETAYSIS